MNKRSSALVLLAKRYNIHSWWTSPDQRISGSAAQLLQIVFACLQRGIGEVAEQAIEPKAIELQVFGFRILVVVKSQAACFAPKRVGMHEQAGLVGVVDQAGSGLTAGIVVVALAIAIAVNDVAC